jgi:hypothetical protein
MLVAVFADARCSLSRRVAPGFFSGAAGFEGCSQ